MPKQVIPQFEFGGEDSRSNPANYPTNRAARCLNWEPQQNRTLRLRRGFTTPEMSTFTVEPIHSAVYYETFEQDRFVLFQQATNLRLMDISDGGVTDVDTLSGSGRFGFFRSNNKVFLGNGVDSMKSFDGTTLRDVGIRAPTSTESSGVTVVESTASTGTWGTQTTLTFVNGYQFYMAYYNPTTGEVGNRVSIGTRLTITGTESVVQVDNLPDLSSVNTEWHKVIGRTPWGGEVPYWLTNENGDLLTAGNTATVATFASHLILFDYELPQFNDVPPVTFDKFARVGTRIWAASPESNVLRYSEDENDAEAGKFVGRPESAWPASNAEIFPTGAVPTCISGYKFEGWFFSKDHLCRFSESLRQAISDPWLGPYPGGCAGQRCFVETPYGPFWLSGDKELLTWGGDGPIPVSDEYQKARLAKLSDSTLSQAEVSYFHDRKLDIDRIEILGLDDEGETVFVVHDFYLKDGQSLFGQSYGREYVRIVPVTFVRSSENETIVRDSTGRRRLWAGDELGNFQQLEDGLNDAGEEFSGDYIGIVSLGDNEPDVPRVAWTGDQALVVSYSRNLNTEIDLFVSKPTVTPMRLPDTQPWDFYQYSPVEEQRGNYLLIRLQLDSHSADDGASYDMGDPPFVPLNPYGTLYALKLQLGREAKENP